jgi:hypothetical protein
LYFDYVNPPGDDATGDNAITLIAVEVVATAADQERAGAQQAKVSNIIIVLFIYYFTG